MLLTDTVTSTSITLPNDLLWEDEFKWEKVVKKAEWGITGSRIVQMGVKLSGRPITLKNPDREMAWVDRSTAVQLIAWANDTTKVLVLTFEYPNDTRSFNVEFRDGGPPIEAEPVAGFGGSLEATDQYLITLYLVQRA